MNKILLSIFFLALTFGNINQSVARCSITGTTTVFTGHSTPSLGISGGASKGTWSSSDTTIATVSSTGVVTGIREGTCEIIFGGLTACYDDELRTPFTVRCDPSFKAKATIEGSSVTITAQHGSGSYSGTGTFTVPSGTYNYTVTDLISGCSSDVSVTVISCTAPSVSLKTTNITCHGLANGSIEAIGVGDDLSYVWSNAGTGETITGLGAGTYTVTVTNGCGSASATGTIIEPTAVVATVSPALTCLTTGYGATSVTLTATGVGGTGIVTGSTAVVSPTTTSTACVDNFYTLTVTDANGCVASATANVKTRDVRCYTPSGIQKVNICHKAAKKSNTLCVDADAVASHLAHGDALGACESVACCTSGLARMTMETDEIASAFTVYPNPAGDMVTVTVPHSENAAQIMLKDLTGRLIMEKTTTNTSVEFNLSEVPSGLYIFYSKIDGIIYTEKFVKN